MSAYLVEGRHVGRDGDLADLAAEVGLDRDDALRSLRAEEHLDAVRADQRQAMAYGIQGVPFFVFAGRYGVSGAQSAQDVRAGARAGPRRAHGCGLVGWHEVPASRSGPHGEEHRHPSGDDGESTNAQASQTGSMRR